MSQETNPTDDDEEIVIPNLEVSAHHALGQIRHVLRTGGTSRAKRLPDVRMSARRTERAYQLADGEIVVVTERVSSKRPAGVDGVIYSKDGSASRWLSHRLLEQFDEDTKEKGWHGVVREVSASWNGAFNFRAEAVDQDGAVTMSGLRPPQIGGLHAIGAHWSLYQQPATVVMPTGTGKTEAMLATLVAYRPGVILVVVPSDVLRDQTSRKFLTLGLLRSLGNVAIGARNPIVGVIRRRPRSAADLDIFERCNVVIATMSAIGEGNATQWGPEVASRTGALIVDEAHHIGATGWGLFRTHFASTKVLQFTATPYRRDGKLVDGKVIYDYPLHLAQKDGYFRHISFEPIYEVDAVAGDRAIATAAIAKLKGDLAAGWDHLVLARCDRIDRARELEVLYRELAPEFKPVLVHSEADDSTVGLAQLRSRSSRVVVCVNMLGEGFDLPQLKIAAIHDTHKSIAVLLQFTGRFTRTTKSVGDATVIANIADQDVSAALERLYSEDADWNQLLSEYSSEAAKSHAALVAFLNESQKLDAAEDDEVTEVSHHLLRPTFSTLIYKADTWTPKAFVEAIDRYVHVHRVWLHAPSNTLYFVTRTEPHIPWTRSRKLRDRQWDLFIIHYDQAKQLLYLSSSDKSSSFEHLAKAVGATELLFGDAIFRCLGRVNRLIFQNVGVRKHGRRNLRFALYTGSDVAEALSLAEKAGSVKSNLSGTGWEGGKPVSIGCSYKGRIWTREPGSIPEFVTWAESVGGKVIDGSIDTAKIIANVLIPREVERLPDKGILSVEWPIEILRQAEERVVIARGDEELSLALCDLRLVNCDVTASCVRFELRSALDGVWATYDLVVGGVEGFQVTKTSSAPVTIRIGKLEATVESYLSSYPPMVRFLDLSELDGNLLVEPQQAKELRFPEAQIEAWDWAGVDITKESIWKGGSERTDSIQWRVAKEFIAGGCDVVFDDDAAGEAADLVCLKEEPDHIRVALVHCKFTQGTTAGERVKDVVEVGAQAVRSAKWKWQFRDLCRHLVGREKRLQTDGRSTRFLAGTLSDINRYARLSRFKEIRAEIVIAQPGLSKSKHTADQAAVLAAAYSYLKETVGVDLDLIASS